MISSVPQSQLPIVQWPVSEDLVVRSIRKEASLRRFQLVRGMDVLAFADLAISEIGQCVQEWTRVDADHNLNVKMFAMKAKAHIYFVVTDIKHQELAVSREASKLNETQWKDRLEKEDPDLTRALFYRLFGSSYLPPSIDWCRTSTHLPEIWKKSNEKSDVNSLHVYVADGLVYEERVLLAVPAQFAPFSVIPDSSERGPVASQSRVQVIERTEEGRKKHLVVKIVEVGTQILHLAEDSLLEDLQAILKQGELPNHSIYWRSPEGKHVVIFFILKIDAGQGSEKLVVEEVRVPVAAVPPLHPSRGKVTSSRAPTATTAMAIEALRNL